MSQLPDSLSYLDLGGTKADYSGVEDTSTDRSATEVNLAFGAIASMSRTTVRAWVKIGVSGAGALTLLDWDACWKGGTVAVPVLTNVSGGQYTVTFPATVLDEQAASHAVNLKAAWASVTADTDIAYVNYTICPNILTANTVRLWCIDSSDTPSAPVSSIITLFVI